MIITLFFRAHSSRATILSKVFEPFGNQSCFLSVFSHTHPSEFSYIRTTKNLPKLFVAACSYTFKFKFLSWPFTDFFMDTTKKGHYEKCRFENCSIDSVNLQFYALLTLTCTFFSVDNTLFYQSSPTCYCLEVDFEHCNFQEKKFSRDILPRH